MYSLCLSVGSLGRCDHANTVANEFALSCAHILVKYLYVILILLFISAIDSACAICMMSVYGDHFLCLIFIATPEVFIVYCKEDGDNVLVLSDFFRRNG